MMKMYVLPNSRLQTKQPSTNHDSLSTLCFHESSFFSLP